MYSKNGMTVYFIIQVGFIAILYFIIRGHTLQAVLNHSMNYLIFLVAVDKAWSVFPTLQEGR
jgi:hypothetical protein